LAFAVSLAGMPCPLASTPAGATAKPSSSSNEAVLDEVWQTVQDHFYDPSLRGLDWTAVRARYEPQAATAGSEDALAPVINAMLTELHASHTELYTPADPAYYQLADIFAGVLRRRGLDRVFPGGKITYPGIGVFAHPDAAGHIFITGVIDGAPAQRAGLLVGAEIVAADGTPFRAILSFRNKIGGPVILSIRRHADGAVEPLIVTPTELQPREMFLQGLQGERAADPDAQWSAYRLCACLVLCRRRLPRGAGAAARRGAAEGRTGRKIVRAKRHRPMVDRPTAHFVVPTPNILTVPP
jgi:carboxyl-terminal processing protease